MSQHNASLLYSESHINKVEAAKRELQIKGWRREKKLALILKSKVSLPWAKPKGVRAGEPDSKIGNEFNHLCRLGVPIH